jgi:hypothetical protein
MKRIGARRLVYCINVAFAAATAVALANCSGGERPPPADENAPDAQARDAATGPVTITGYDDKAGILFGENGFVNCGSQASDQTITLKNPNDDVVNFTAKLSVGADKFKIQPESGGVPSHGQINVQILANPIPAKADVAADNFAGTLEVKFATGEPPTIIRLHQTARGAIIRTTVVGGQVIFGDVKVNTSGEQRISLTNSGNQEVTANLQVGSPEFKVDGDTIGTVTLAGGATVSKTLAFGPTQVLPYTDTLALNFNSSAVLCDVAPGNVTLKGNGTSSVSVTPGVLPFGQVDCLTAAPFQTVKIASTTTMSFTPTLAAGGLSKFTLADSAGSPVADGVPVIVQSNVDYMLRVVPKVVPRPSPITDNALGDKLTITTDVPLDKPHDVDLRMTAKGAILDFGQTSISNTGDISRPGQPVTFTSNISVVNTGNQSANYSVAVVQRDGDSTPIGTLTAAFNPSLSTGAAQPGTTPGTLISTAPTTYSTTILGALQLTAPGAVLCEDLPAKMPLTVATVGGNSVTLAYSGAPGTLNFGTALCGGPAAAFKAITVTSIVATTITPDLVKGSGSPFTLADSNGAPLTLASSIPIAANTPYTLRVVPKIIPTNVGVAGLSQSDTLTIATAADPPPSKSVNLAMTAQGAIFALTPGQITCGTAPPGGTACASATFPISVTNSGNIAGAYTIVTPSYLTSNIPTPSPGSVPPGNTVNGILTKTGTGTIETLKIQSTTAQCADLPPPTPVIIY